VELLDSNGHSVLDVVAAFPCTWWQRSRRAWASGRPRPRLDVIFPIDLSFDWPNSTVIFGRATPAADHFTHRVAPAVIKWVARVRCGCLATHQRLHVHKMGPSSPACPCCNAPVEDEPHVLTGCPSTGSADWAASFSELWAAAALHCNVQVPLPPAEWVSTHSLPLAAALIPESCLWHHPLPPDAAPRFLRRLHVLLAERLAEWLRRREELRAVAASSSSPVLPDSAPADSSWTRGHRRPCALPTERRLSVVDLRQAEQPRLQAATLPGVPPLAAPPGPLPLYGPTRLRHLRQLLHQLLQRETSPCPARSGSTSETFLALFETSSGEPFAPSPGLAPGQRITAMGKSLGFFIDKPQLFPFDPPLQRISRSGTYYYSRAPLRRVDTAAWRQSLLGSAASPPAVDLSRPASAMGLASWIRHHPHLRAAAIDQGESGMALLLLWEVEHGGPFPSTAANRSSSLLTGFTRRLQNAIAQDTNIPPLGEWLSMQTMGCPLGPGLPPTYHARWSVRITPPSAPADWYAQFTARWRAYLLSLVCPASPSSAVEASSSSSAALPRPPSPGPPDAPVAASTSSAAPSPAPGPPRGRTNDSAVPPAKRHRTNPPERPIAPAAPRAPSAPQRAPPYRPRSASPGLAQPPRKKQSTLASWLQPPRQRPAAHGRATEGPPT
jgi:hypothetical protein